jgi:hypothetical protein
VTDLATARSRTRDHLEALRGHMKHAVEQGTDVSEAVKSLDAKPPLHLSNAAELSLGHASRTCLEVERE